MSYICRDCKFKIDGATSNPPRCPNCGSMYLLQCKNKIRKLKEQVRRVARLRKSKEEPFTIYDRLFSSFFIVFVAVLTLVFGPILSMILSGRGGSMDVLIWEYQFILEWWPSILFGSALVGFVFGVDRVLDFFGLVWGTMKENKEIMIVMVIFVVAVIAYAFAFQ
ncbi:MAG: hypothetical protein OQK69_04815 [Gammaproteobacteria bacterium]|nr:hypothetical protein [Gammaproteobacteria bacterium]